MPSKTAPSFQLKGRTSKDAEKMVIGGSCIQDGWQGLTTSMGRRRGSGDKGFSSLHQNEKALGKVKQAHQKEKVLLLHDTSPNHRPGCCER